MRHVAGIGRLGMLAVGLGIGAALAATPGVASADPSTDPFSSIDQLLGGLSVPAADPAQTLDIQVDISGLDLFPTAGNTATATANALGDIAIAIGNGADASAVGGPDDFAFADGANSIAEAGAGEFGTGGSDSALVFGANSTAEAGFVGAEDIGGTGDSALVFGANSTAEAGSVAGIGNFDLAAAFGDMLHAIATDGNFLVDILPSL